MIEVHGPGHEDWVATFVEDVAIAAGAIRIVSWEAIRRERVSMTPKGLYDELQKVIDNCKKLKDIWITHNKGLRPPQPKDAQVRTKYQGLGWVLTESKDNMKHY